MDLANEYCLYVSKHLPNGRPDCACDGVCASGSEDSLNIWGSRSPDKLVLKFSTTRAHAQASSFQGIAKS
ncbi:hypothetical protein J6590_012934 [Homalodisca vitripennis]|nr:hypothetical protein J6590_012934 [Homalodisca vitripennis]